MIKIEIDLNAVAARIRAGERACEIAVEFGVRSDTLRARLRRRGLQTKRSKNCRRDFLRKLKKEMGSVVKAAKLIGMSRGGYYAGMK